MMDGQSSPYTFHFSRQLLYVRALAKVLSIGTSGILIVPMFVMLTQGRLN